MFPDFRNIKNKNEKWLKTIYLQNDIHLSKKGNSLLAEKLILVHVQRIFNWMSI